MPAICLPRLGIWFLAALGTDSMAPARAQDPTAPHKQGASVALAVAVAHPAAGPDVEDATILIEDGVITAVGPRAGVAVPSGVPVRSFPTAHAYPGLVDAASAAFADASVREDAGADAGTAIAGGLDPTDRDSLALVRAGVTTAYVSNHGEGAWRGLGALVNPRRDGFAFDPNDNARGLAVHLRLGGADNQHPLDRAKARRAAFAAFDALEEYRDKQKEYREAVEKYGVDFDAYLARLGKEKPSDKKGSDKEPVEKDNDKANPEAGSQGPPDANGGAAKPSEKAPAEKGPQKPKYPTAPTVDAAKEALLLVQDGKLPLWIEANRADDVAAALELAASYGLRRVVLQVDAAQVAGDWKRAGLPAALAARGIPVVIAGLAPKTQPTYHEDADASALPAALSAAGVTLAIGSGSVREARALPLVAAAAAGRGMAPRAAVAAITTDAAAILGVGDRAGSLAVGRSGDVLLCSGPLLASDSRVVAVFARGEAQYDSGAEGDK